MEFKRGRAVNITAYGTHEQRQENNGNNAHETSNLQILTEHRVFSVSRTVWGSTERIPVAHDEQAGHANIAKMVDS